MQTKDKLLVICLLFSIIPLSAQTIVNKGEVSGRWILNLSPYLIRGDIYVPQNKVLTIEAGVKVIFQTQSRLLVEGRLLAIGNEADSITFTAARAETGWAGICWLNTGILERNELSELAYCKFSLAKSQGRFPMNYGGAITILNTNNVVVSHCLFEDCEALNWGEAEAKGGALALVNSDAKISHCTFQDNTSKFGGALALISGSNPVIDNCLFVRNTALQYGGAVEILERSSPSFVNCTFADNFAELGGGAIDLSASGQACLLNSIVWNNQSGRVFDAVSMRTEDCNIMFSYCNVEGGAEEIEPHPTTNKSVGNMDADPGFMGFGDHPFRPATNSVCIDAGTTATAFLPVGWNMKADDIAGNFRVFNKAIDMGCYEYIFEGPLPPAKEKIELLPGAKPDLLLYPCPARTLVNFRYSLATQSNVRLIVFDLQGHLVADLLNEPQDVGVQTFTWNLGMLPKGTYMYKMRIGQQVLAGRILLVN